VSGVFHENLDSQFLRRLEHLQLLTKKMFSGNMRGERRSKKKGASVEFADFKEYNLGDDFRYIDWNAYARLETLILKLFHGRRRSLNLYSPR
jgi:uncharacterized protein (DUF58 family)